MKKFNLFAALLAVTCFAFIPAVLLADDALEDLDTTMIVVDDAGELEASIDEMRNPDDDGVRNDDWQDAAPDGEGGEQAADGEESAPREANGFEDDEESDDDFDHDNEEEEALEEFQENLDDGDEVDFDIVEVGS